MRSKRIFIDRMTLMVMILIGIVFVATTCVARVLNNFPSDGKAGTSPLIGLVFDATGNLYGTTYSGGSDDHGTVFELMANGDGTWTEKVLYSFGNVLDGLYPLGGVIFDAAGNLYGTTSSGGPKTGGTVFELIPGVNGTWTKTILFAFGRGQAGVSPACTLVFDSLGNLYGTTQAGGTSQLGTVFELMPNGDGSWSEIVRHSFRGSDEGAFPYAGLTIDAAGHLYGTTFEAKQIQDSPVGPGIVFELTPTSKRLWRFKVLHKFKNDGHDGTNPIAGIILDAAGNIYGTTFHGGALSGGTAFELTPNMDGTWTHQTLHNFKNDGHDGFSPIGGLLLDSGGDLLGTTELGGTNDQGTVFELSKNSDGSWSETLLHQFKDDGHDGRAPWSNVISDTQGNLYGTTAFGGIHQGGTVFEVTQ